MPLQYVPMEIQNLKSRRHALIMAFGGTKSIFGGNQNHQELKSQKKEEQRKIFAFAKWWKQFKSIWEAKDTLRYNLQLRTKSDYGRKDNKKNGKQQMISYKISVLWDKSFN